MRYGLIAGNGKFPFLVLEGARKAGVSLAVAAIREETDPAIERVAERMVWVSIGQLGKMIRFFKREGVTQAIMAGQVKHVQIFSGALPDVRMLRVLLRLPRRNTDALIGAVADELASEGIELIDSTFFLQDHLAEVGTLTRRRLTVVKVAKPSQDMRFDVPVIGVPTIESMIEAGATCLCITARKTLMFDREQMLRLANEKKISV